MAGELPGSHNQGTPAGPPITFAPAAGSPVCPQGHRGVPTMCTPRCCGATDTQSPHCFQVVYSRSTRGTGLIAHPGIQPSQVNSAPRCLCCSRGSGAPGEDSGGEAQDRHTPPACPCPHPRGADPAQQRLGAVLPWCGGTSLTAGGSSGSVPPFSRNLEKVSTSRVLLYSTICSHGMEWR